MTKLAKVILKTTSGDELTCSVHHNVGAGRVELPARLADLIDDAEANGEKYVLVLLDNGFQYPLVLSDDGGTIATGTKSASTDCTRIHCGRRLVPATAWLYRSSVVGRKAGR